MQFPYQKQQNGMNFALHKDLGVDEISPPTRYAPLRHKVHRERLIGFGLKFWEKIECERVNPFILSHSTLSRYSIMLRKIETRCAGILSKTGTWVCASLRLPAHLSGG